MVNNHVQFTNNVYYYPILITVRATGKQMLVKSPDELPSGVPFIVNQVNVVSAANAVDLYA